MHVTRPEDRVQPGSDRDLNTGTNQSCDPHPVRRPGAARPCWRSRSAGPRRCDPHPVRRPGAARVSGSAPSCGTRLRSSPGPKTGCSVVGRIGAPACPVAILTRSGDRVQLRWVERASPRHRRCDPHPVRRPGAARVSDHRSPWSTPTVAILTRSEDRVQHRAADRARRPTARLRSSPGPKTGCSGRAACRRAIERRRCDPHPVRRPGAAGGTVGAAWPVSARCDPHPVRRPGAAATSIRRVGGLRKLRSSPGPKTGCSSHAAAAVSRLPPVAILTRSEDRVQRGRRAAWTGDGAWLRSSPGPKTGCSSTRQPLTLRQ